MHFTWSLLLYVQPINKLTQCENHSYHRTGKLLDYCPEMCLLCYCLPPKGEKQLWKGLSRVQVLSWTVDILHANNFFFAVVYPNPKDCTQVKVITNWCPRTGGHDPWPRGWVVSPSPLTGLTWERISWLGWLPQTSFADSSTNLSGLPAPQLGWHVCKLGLEQHSPILEAIFLKPGHT